MFYSVLFCSEIAILKDFSISKYILNIHVDNGLGPDQNKDQSKKEDEMCEVSLQYVSLVWVSRLSFFSLRIKYKFLVLGLEALRLCFF